MFVKLNNPKFLKFDQLQVDEVWIDERDIQQLYKQDGKCYIAFYSYLLNSDGSSILMYAEITEQEYEAVLYIVNFEKGQKIQMNETLKGIFNRN